jgi:Domain of unknown function (DUF4399)
LFELISVLFGGVIMNSFGHSVSRRRFIRLATVGGGVVASGLLAACSNTPTSTEPEITIAYPHQGAHVEGTKASIQVAVKNWRLVNANQDVHDGEGHIHFFIDTPADSVPVGTVIPTDKPAQYVHVGKPPLATRTLELTPGVHTVTVVMGNSHHEALDKPAPVSVTFAVG